MNWRLITALLVTTALFGLVSPSTAQANPPQDGAQNILKEPLLGESWARQGALLAGGALGLTAIYLIFQRQGPITEAPDVNFQEMQSDEFSRRLEISRVVDPHTPEAPLVIRLVSLRF
jgi:hypothetical protein